jgi:hypothetical protein
MKSWFVENNALHAAQGGFDLEIRLPWYRSLPLSVIDFGELRINGAKIDPTAIKFNVNGKDCGLSELPNLWEESWYVLDSAYLRIPYPAVKRGEQYQVEVTIILHPPYVPKVFFPVSYKKAMQAN